MEQIKGLLSVIVPVYNVEKYLEKCVDSLIRQTYPNLQIILVDDGSTDVSGALCDKLAQADNRVEVIHQQNGGQARARNAGLQNVKGQYIAFVDSDDYVALNTYELAIRAMEEHDADVVRFDFVSVSGSTTMPEMENNKPASILGIEDLIDGLAIQRTRLTVWNAVYRRDTVEGIGFVPDVIYEDVFFTNKILLKSSKEVLIDVPFYRYLAVREGNTNSQRFVPSKRLPVLKEFEDMRECLIKKGVSKTCIQIYNRYCFSFGFTLYWQAYCGNADQETMKTIFCFCHGLFQKIDFHQNKSKMDLKWRMFHTAPQMYCYARKNFRK